MGVGERERGYLQGGVIHDVDTQGAAYIGPENLHTRGIFAHGCGS